MLAAELAADGQPAEARRLAGLTLKNQLTAKVKFNWKKKKKEKTNNE